MALQRNYDAIAAKCDRRSSRLGRVVFCTVLLLWSYGTVRADIYQPVRLENFDDLASYLARQDSLNKRRNCVIETAESQLHVREKYHATAPHYRNEHSGIYQFFAACGFKGVSKWPWRQRAWCAAFATWVLKSCGEIKKVATNMVAVKTWDAMISKRLKPGEKPLVADLVTYKPWSHIEFIKKWPPDPRIKVFYATGGNTSGGAGYEGVHTNIPRPKAWAKRVVRVISN